MSEKNRIFKPIYPARIKLTIYLYPLGVVLFLFFLYQAVVTGRFFPYGIFAMVFGFPMVTMPLIIFREIHFSDDRLFIKRYFFPSRTVAYRDIVEITSRGLVAKKGGLPFINVINRKEFEKTLHKYLKQQKI